MLNVVLRTVFFYFFILIAYRIMGKREVGQLGVIDLIISILIAELVAISIENYKESMLFAILPISVLIILEVFLAILNLKSRKVNKVLEGKPTLIISQGKLIYSNLIKQRYSLDDLLLQLRQNGIASIEEVEYALLETNGKLSIFKYNFLKIKSDLPLPVIVEGKIQEDTLKELKKEKIWIEKILYNNNLKLEDVFYAFYKKTHLYIIRYK